MDTRTLLQVLLVIQAASTLALWFNWRRHPTIEGTGWWATGALGSLVGLVLIVLRQVIPDVLSVIASNLILAAAHGAVLTGHHRFAGTRPPIAVVAVLLAGLAAALIWHTYVDPSVPGRIVSTMIVTIVSCALLLRALWPLLRVEGYRVVILLIAVTTAYLVLSLWRVVATVHAEPALSGLFSASLIQPAFYYVLIAYCVARCTA